MLRPVRTLRVRIAETDTSQAIGGKAETHKGPANGFRALPAELQVVNRRSPIIAVTLNHYD